MRVGLVTNLQSRGLAMDARLLEGLLTSLGHEVVLIQYDTFYEEPADLLIFCEVVVPRFFSLSKSAPWLFVNPEFLFERDFKTIRTQFAKILCKTHEAHRICSQHFGIKAVYTGFLSADKMDSSIPREDRFLHVAGSSKIKGTAAVIDAWKWTHNGESLNAPLTVVSDWWGDENITGMIDLLKDVSEEELTRLQNSHKFHLQPSGTEGFGHALREALSVNAVILTTGAPPMNELTSVYEIPAVGSSMCREAEVHEVSAIDIHKAVKDMLETHRASFHPREEFLAGNAEFKQRFSELLDTLKPLEHRLPVKFDRDFPGQLRVAFLGNFAHSFCTEADLAYSLEWLGHEVIRVQESTATISELHGASLDADLFLWVHTHSFNTLSDDELLSFLEHLKRRSIPSVSFHLDRFFSIPERESRIGIDPFWKTSYVFSADGGHQAEFWAKGVNHFYLPPAVVSRGVHGGFPRGDLRCDVGFVGSVEGYHANYPFRAEMVDFLERRYGARFRRFSGVREAELNDVYASCSVVAGDSIFANDGLLDRYFSDRIPETMGRGGVLVHAEVKGLDWPGLTLHRPGDLEDMVAKIDFLLQHPVERRRLRDVGMEFVRQNHTYLHRAKEILSTCLHS